MMYNNPKVPAPEESYAPLTSFVPRVSESDNGIICEMKITTDEITLTGTTLVTICESDKSNIQGFTELNFGYVYDNDIKTSSKRKFVSIYVEKNTALLMYDIGSITTITEIAHDQNLTLFQEGAFVYVDADILFRLCDDTELKLYNCKELYD
jgi:hypothetical protein